MKKLTIGLVAVAAVLVAALAYLAFNPVGQHPDRSFDAAVSRPAYTDHHPLVLVDEGHYNAHTARAGYAPFARLLGNDGYEVRRHRGRFTPESLSGASVLVIVNAAGGSNPKFAGFNLQFLRKGERGAPAFSEAEVAAVREWVEGGGSLLLIADHTPFGSAAAAMAAAFGVTLSECFTDVADMYPGQPEPGELEFSRANGLLGEHPINEGRFPEERVSRVRTFTGQSLGAAGTGDAAVLLRLPSTAVDWFPNEPTPRVAGSAQGLALEIGRGRVVALGEAAMLTAQAEGDRRWGMSMKDLDNRQFALNVAHWLSRGL